MQFISDHLFNNVCKADFYCSLYRITCLLTFVKQISTAVYIGSLVYQGIGLIVHTINFSRCSFDAFTSITALHVYISAFFINMFYRPQHVVITYKAWSFNTIVFSAICRYMYLDIQTMNIYMYYIPINVRLKIQAIPSSGIQTSRSHFLNPYHACLTCKL